MDTSRVNKGAQTQIEEGKQNAEKILNIISSTKQFGCISLNEIIASSTLSRRSVNTHIEAMLNSDKPMIKLVSKDIYAAVGVTLTEAQINAYKEYLDQRKIHAKRDLTSQEIEEYKTKILKLLTFNKRDAISAKTISDNPEIQLSVKNTELVLKSLTADKKIAVTMTGATTQGPLYYKIKST